ncbi:hypothetical protein [Baaleninema sp.]|uniref:hypothetical protein n=1 Tax=Baaleninema sp. TaxID=3101197 RepID=UPI003D049403
MITEGIDWIESGENYYDDDNPLEADVFQVIPSIDTYLDRNDGHNAIAILEVVTDVYFKRRDDLYNYGLDLLDFCEELDRLWAKALLIADLEEPKKIDLEVVFASQAEIFSSLFSLRRLALEKGWEDETLQQVLTGELPENFNEPSDLVGIRLELLKRQKRFDEYLNLSRYTGRIDLYFKALIYLDRSDEVLAQIDLIQTKPDAYIIAEAFAEKEQLEAALTVALNGLNIPFRELITGEYFGRHAIEDREYQSRLEMLAFNLSEDLDRGDVGFSSKIEGFKAEPSYRQYLQIKDESGEDWENQKIELLASFKGMNRWQSLSDRIQIYLYEQMFDKAIDLVKECSYEQRDLIQQVMDAVLEHRTNWVLEDARSRAEEILNVKQAKAYHYAVDWLKYVKRAYEQLDNWQGWQSYRDGLIQEHNRKYKFMGLFNEADL